LFIVHWLTVFFQLHSRAVIFSLRTLVTTLQPLRSVGPLHRCPPPVQQFAVSSRKSSLLFPLFQKFGVSLSLIVFRFHLFYLSTLSFFRSSRLPEFNQSDTSFRTGTRTTFPTSFFSTPIFPLKSPRSFCSPIPSCAVASRFFSGEIHILPAVLFWRHFNPSSFDSIRLDDLGRPVSPASELTPVVLSPPPTSLFSLRGSMTRR